MTKKSREKFKYLDDEKNFEAEIKSISHQFLRALTCSVRNSPRQSANAEAFAEAYLHFIVFASAIKMPRQLSS